jgi:hypothetical protein
VSGEKVFIGGHYRKEQMQWSLRYGSWDLGMIFEEWRNGKYAGSWRVVVAPIAPPKNGTPVQPEQAIEPIDRKPKGDGRILKP